MDLIIIAALMFSLYVVLSRVGFAKLELLVIALALMVYVLKVGL